MATRNKWLAGCGIGCAVMILVNVIGVFTAVKLAKHAFGDLEVVSELQDQLSDRYGAVEDYTPPADGAVSPKRMEIFLLVQQSVHPASVMLDRNVSVFRGLKSNGVKNVGRVISIINAVRGIARDVSGYLHIRNRIMLEQGMGLGEFTYIYVLAYHAWLGHELLDIPGESDDDGPTTGERLHDNLVTMLRSQRDALKLQVTEDDPLLKALEAEILEMRIDDTRMIWQDGLPESIEASLRPYRERLEKWHVPVSYLVGIGAENDAGGLDFQFN